MVGVRYFNIIWLVVAALLLQGCPKGIAITVHNNTESDLFVVLNKGQIRWPHGTSLHFDNDEVWVRDDGRYTPMLSIKWKSAVLTYKLFSLGGLPAEYIGYSTGNDFSSGTQDYQFQLEPDRNLYVVKPGDPFPAKQLYPRPITPGVVSN